VTGRRDPRCDLERGGQTVFFLRGRVFGLAHADRHRHDAIGWYQRHHRRQSRRLVQPLSEALEGVGQVRRLRRSRSRGDPRLRTLPSLTVHVAWPWASPTKLMEAAGIQPPRWIVLGVFMGRGASSTVCHTVLEPAWPPMILGSPTSGRAPFMVAGQIVGAFKADRSRAR